MADRTLARTRKDLSEFLTRHRRKLAPVDAGLPSSGHRRTPGLRREEVAALASVGLTWYTWFEQGRDIQVSESFLLKVAKALKLDDAECSHLFLLAHRRPPPPEAYHWPSVSPLIQQLLDDIVTRPAYVVNLRWDVVAWNVAANDLFGFKNRERPDRNIIRLIFANPEFRRRIPQWHDEAPKLLTRFRSDMATAPNDPAMLALVDELKNLSPDFRLWFEKPGVECPTRGIGNILDPEGRQLSFIHEMLTVDEYKHLKLVVYFRQ
ncbi:helix-turn-helix transcriptional regulator [Phyllobacterium sp. TAF24]|uniref:helix-turn-helix transcriptional regulator n=1 Tax=Phyllobacterium sp. TAF24 TaxID=3233068 RepID=UPI003F9533FA